MDEIDEFIEKYKIPMLMQEEIENLNRWKLNNPEILNKSLSKPSQPDSVQNHKIYSS